MTRICAGCVFRCFRTLERWGNYFTGAAGPYFVGLACILIGTGVICFCRLSGSLRCRSAYWSLDIAHFSRCPSTDTSLPNFDNSTLHADCTERRHALLLFHNRSAWIRRWKWRSIVVHGTTWNDRLNILGQEEG